MQSTRKRKWRCSHDKSSRDCAPHPLARVKTLARECLWRGEIDKMYYRNVDLPSSTLQQWQTMIEPSSWCCRKFRKYFTPFAARRFAKIPARYRYTCNAYVNNGALRHSLNVDTLIGSAPNPRADWLSAIMIFRPSTRYLRINAGNVSSSLSPVNLSPRLSSLFLSLPLLHFPSAFHSPNKSLNESPLTLNYYYLSLYRLTLYSIVSLQKYIYHYFSALWLLKTYR